MVTAHSDHDGHDGCKLVKNCSRKVIFFVPPIVQTFTFASDYY